MDSNAKVTIIMSNYNQEKYIEQAIESVLVQKTNFEWQLIITDDHSTKDNSVEIIKKYVEKYPNKIKALLNQENGKYLKNILRAKAITKTEYFCLLDSDDYWTDKNYLQDAVDFLDKNPDYTIYSRNVICKKENGEEFPFFDLKNSNAHYSIDDYIKGIVQVTQTTGSFFRNVIFKNGIPETMQNAIGTISERSFEGDYGRYLMHLKYGKAYYDSRPSGVYRILDSGIWTKLSNFEKHLLSAQFYFDINKYYEYRLNDFFLNLMHTEYNLCINDIINSDAKYEDFSENAKNIFLNISICCSKNKNKILENLIKDKKLKLKYKILLFLYKKLYKKLFRHRCVY